FNRKDFPGGISLLFFAAVDRANQMKWEIIHRTEYTYASPVRESFNEVRLQPFSDPGQHVDDFLLKVLPASRLRHYHDFYSNVVHHFEIPDPHSSLSIESRTHVSVKALPLLSATDTPWPLARIGEAAHQPHVFEFLPESRYVELSADAWKLA